LRVRDFVAGQEHWHALRDQHGGQEIAFLPLAELEDGFVVSRPFGPAIPTVVVVGAVAVFLAVGLVMLVVVAHEVVQAKTVVAGDEIDAGGWAAAVVHVEIARAGEPRGELADGAAVSFPEFADAIAVAAVPLGPEHGKIADLIAVRADIPRLSYELHL